MPAFGSEWSWTADIAPAFAIEGRTPGAFLEHLANEEGWTLRYADATIADSAGRTSLASPGSRTGHDIEPSPRTRHRDREREVHAVRVAEPIPDRRESAMRGVAAPD